MRYARFRGVALAAATALLSVGLAACDDENPMTEPDLSASNDLSGNPDMAGEDMAAEEPANGQIVLADVTGVPWIAVPDGGMPLPNPLTGQPFTVHAFAALADFPMTANSSQHSTLQGLNGCTWNRYDLADVTKLPKPNDNAGSVEFSGYDTTYTRATNVVTMAVAAPDPLIKCEFNSTSFHYDCHFGATATATNGVSAYIFAPSPIPTPSPSPAPQFYNTDLFGSANSVTEKLIANTSSSWTDAMSTLPQLPQPAYIVSVNGDSTKHNLTDLDTKFNGEITIEYACMQGATTKGQGCPTTSGTLTGLLIETSQGKKWQPAVRGVGARFGTMQCVEADGPSTTRTFTLTQQMVADIMGSDTGQSVRVVLVRLKANPASSGNHLVFLTAGRGNFAYVDQ